MAKYFTLTHGLRGCYMPDSDPTVIMVETRRELKKLITGEAAMLATEATLGLSKRAIASFAATCWREAQKAKPAYLPHNLPCKERGQSSYSYGIFCSVASRRDYLEAQNAGE
jgi:hypothetical protein